MFYRRFHSKVAGVAILPLVLVFAGCIDAPADETTGSGTGTWLHPTVLKRDNPALGGRIVVTGTDVKGVVGSDRTTLSTAKWEKAEGYLEMKELRADNSLFATFKSPLLPREDFSAPGPVNFGSRATAIVHGNKYAVRAVGWGTGNGTQVTETTHYALSDDVLVVPVLVVNWIARGSRSDSSLDSFISGLFDYYPTTADYPSLYPNSWRPGYPRVIRPRTGTLGILNATSFRNGSSTIESFKPTMMGTPPDDIFATCGIQFQVVEQITAREPEGYVAGERCNEQQDNLPNPNAVLTAARGDNPRTHYINYTLNPIRAAFANFDCHYWAGHTTGARGIEVDRGGNPRVVAHELLHLLGHPNHDRRDPSLLIHFSYSGTRITPGQCETARTWARDYSARYDEYNRVAGRTYSTTPAVDIWSQGPTMPEDGGFGSPEMPSDLDRHVCCKNSNDEGWVGMTALACAAQGRREVRCPMNVPR